MSKNTLKPEMQHITGQLKAFAASFRWIVKLSDLLDEIGPLELACTETSGRLEGLREEEKVLSDSIQGLTDTADTARQAAESSSGDAAKVLSEARLKASGILEDAAQTADERLQEASDEASKVTALATEDVTKIQAKVSDSNEELQELNFDISQGQKDLSDLKGKVREANEFIDRVNRIKSGG